MSGVLILMSSMLFFQVGGSFATMLMKDIGPFGATALRQFFSAIALVIIARLWKVDFKKIKIVKIIPYGLFLGLMNLTFYIAIDRIPLGIAVAIEFAGPLLVGIISSRRATDFVWVAFACIGLYFLMPFSMFTGEKLDTIGVIAAVVSAIGWGGYIITGHKISHEIDGNTAVAIGIIVASFVTVPLGIFDTGVKLFEPSILLFGLALGLLTNAIPYAIEMMALKRLSRQTFSLTLALEPAFGAIAGMFLLHQKLEIFQALGIGLIIVATIGSTLSMKKEAMPEKAS